MKKGFTLIELLVVIAIIGILASIVLASIDGAKKRSGGESTMVPKAHAETVLPEGVSKFTDDGITCYILNKYSVIGSNDRASGISCVVQ